VSSIPPEIIPPCPATTPEGEALRPVPGFPGYTVTAAAEPWGYASLGRGKGRGWRPLKVSQDNGYGIVRVSRPRRRLIRVHTLVLLAFVGPCPDGMECLHGDGDPANNALSNLRWGTHKENVEDAVRHGTQRRGERHPFARLTEADVKALRTPGGPTPAEVARLRGVKPSTAVYARGGRNWKHVA
jgi:hypothetical protein